MFTSAFRAINHHRMSLPALKQGCQELSSPQFEWKTPDVSDNMILGAGAESIAYRRTGQQTI
jgi:hypothetical protein